MAYATYVEAVFGAGLVSDTIMEHLRQDLIGDLGALLASVYAVYGGGSAERMLKSLKAKSLIEDRLPVEYDEHSLRVPHNISTIMVFMSRMSESRFVEEFTQNDMSFLDQLKVKKIMQLFLEVKDIAWCWWEVFFFLCSYWTNKNKQSYDDDFAIFVFETATLWRVCFEE